MRMSLMFAAVTLLTGINLFFIPFQPVPALWGGILAVAFILINVVADKLRLCRMLFRDFKIRMLLPR
ncbi:hypothetical protein GSE34_23750 [Klebsiella variicola]|nr:hypothetical protein [Klebsiella variicola]